MPIEAETSGLAEHAPMAHMSAGLHMPRLIKPEPSRHVGKLSPIFLEPTTCGIVHEPFSRRPASPRTPVVHLHGKPEANRQAAKTYAEHKHGGLRAKYYIEEKFILHKFAASFKFFDFSR